MADCSACNQGDMEEQVTEVWMRRHDGGWALLREVPALVCDLCGEIIFREDVSQQMAEILGPGSKVAKVGALEFPVYDFRDVERQRRFAELSAIGLANPLQDIYRDTIPSARFFYEEAPYEEFERVGT